MAIGRNYDGTVGPVAGPVNTFPTIRPRQDEPLERRDGFNARLEALREQRDAYEASGLQIPDHLARLLRDAENAGEKRETREGKAPSDADEVASVAPEPTPEVVAEPEPEPPAPEPVVEPVVAEPEPEPEPVVAEPEPPAPEPEPTLVTKKVEVQIPTPRGAPRRSPESPGAKIESGEIPTLAPVKKAPAKGLTQSGRPSPRK